VQAAWSHKAHRCQHCTYKSKHICLEINWAASFPISTFMCLAKIYIFPWSVLFGITVLLFCMKELSAQLQDQTKGQGPAAKHWLMAVPCPPLRSCSWAGSSHKWPTYKFPIWKITDHKWKQLILVVSFLFGLTVNEIPNKKFISDSPRTFICSEVLWNAQVLLCFFLLLLCVSLSALCHLAAFASLRDGFGYVYSRCQIGSHIWSQSTWIIVS
jgi:hypothetical protein